MSNKTKGIKGGGAMGQPLDPTRSGEDYFGDTTGLTGVTSDKNPKKRQKLAPELYDDEEYEKNMLQTNSNTRAKFDEDVASEDEIESSPDLTSVLTGNLDPDVEPYTVNKKDATGNDSPGTDNLNTIRAAYNAPEHLGEQSISGSAPDPTADDDTLEAAQAMGTQLGEDDEHPQELNIARDFDNAEESIRNH